MDVLEKILEEIEAFFDENTKHIEDLRGVHHFVMHTGTAKHIVNKTIRSYMDEVAVKHNEGGHVFIADKEFLDKQKAVSKEFLQECKEVADKYRKGNRNDDWIPVTERLPEEGTMVIGFQDGMMLIGELFIDKRTGGIGVDDADQTLRDISAWMPAPPEYKAE